MYGQNHRESNLEVENLKSIGFYITASQSQIDAGFFSEQIEKNSIRAKVSTRIQRYADDEDHHYKLSNWFQKYFKPMLEVTKIDAVNSKIIQMQGEPDNAGDIDVYRIRPGLDHLSRVK